MKRSLYIFLIVISLLAFFTGLKVAQVFPSHPQVAMFASIIFVAVLIIWQFAYRFGVAGGESLGARLLAWAVSLGLGIWATFLLLASFVSVAEIALMALPHGKGFAGHLPIFVALASVAIALLGLKQAIHGPRVVKRNIKVPKLKVGLQGLKIAQISDLHVGPTIRHGHVESVVEQVLSLKPDLIAITGDLVDGTVERLSIHVAPLEKLTAPLGVYFVPGNHEYYSGVLEWLAKMTNFGFTTLINENRIVSKGGATLLVGGVADEQGEYFLAEHRLDHAAAVKGGENVDFKILLAHRPDNAAVAAKVGFDLQLSGHTHAGQFFPANLLIGLFHRHLRGLGKSGRMHIHVSPGTGYWGPAHRFAIPAEITLLELQQI